MNEVQKQFFFKYGRFFLLKLLATRAQYLLFGPEKSSKINDGSLAEINLDWIKNKENFTFCSITYWDDLIKWSECDVMAGTELLTNRLCVDAEYKQTKTH